VLPGGQGCVQLVGQVAAGYVAAGVKPLTIVVPMALCKHVAGQEELFNGMVDVVIGEIDPPARGADWKTAVRQRVLSARRVLLRHRGP
jgi:hypothetical protein